MRTLLTFRKYAVHRGVSVQAVSKAVAAGRITTVSDVKGRRRIDPEVADIQWSRNTDPVQAQRAAGQRVQAPPTMDHSPADPRAAQSVRDRVETARAELLELELQEKRGILVKVEDVKRRAFELARAMRDALQALPPRVAAQVAAESDAARCHDILAAEVGKVCAEVGKVCEENASADGSTRH
jgi:hypothetical protein